MPTLQWVGKDKVVNHHHDVPFRLLNKQYTFKANDGMPTNSTGNRIIHGDNLEALKSLLPEFEGKVDCIYVDPPYNTGNEGWVYNDAVNDPKIQKWLGQVVGKEGEDLSRHDKWLCMMYPRLKLLHRLLAHNGVMFASIDRFEMTSFKLLFEEVFGARNWIGEIVWKNVTDNNPTNISLEHEYILCYAKHKDSIDPVWKSSYLASKQILIDVGKKLIEQYTSLEEIKSQYAKWFKENKHYLGMLDRYKYIDDGGVYTGSQSVHNPGKEGYRYDVVHPITQRPCKQPLMGYRFPEETMQNLLTSGRILFGDDETKLIELKLYAKDYKSRLSSVLELDGRTGTNELKTIFSESNRPFDYPKPSVLLEEILEFVVSKNAIVLDSFAGSGTTAHAILKLNARDGGCRRFILCEMMDYAETTTAERVRRVMNGYGEDTKAVAGTGGNFDYYTVGEALFNDDNNLNEDVGEAAIREYVAYTESIPAELRCETDSPVSRYALGASDTLLCLFYYERERVTTLNLDFLASLNIKALLKSEGKVKKRPERFLVYADKCALDNDFLIQHGITFKRIPRDITRI
jgi:adenine-specific DNA-methyltransferase